MRPLLVAIYLRSLRHPRRKRTAVGLSGAVCRADLATISEIELVASTGQAPGEKIAAAFFHVMGARKACAEGRVSEALATYDDISFD